MSSDESITLNPAKHDKLGVYHCDVVIEGRIAVAGGESIFFERSGITATRNGSDYTFSRG